MHFRFYGAFFVFTFFVQTVAISQEETSKERKRPFGPVLKFEVTSPIQNYSKILVGVEYFVADRFSLQHHVGPVVSIENFNFDTPEYDRFWGFVLNNEMRYYFFNTALNRKKEDRRTIRSGYFALEGNYNYTSIDSYWIFRYDCDVGNCGYDRKVDDRYSRNWLGGAGLIGWQFIFARKFSLDINAGVGLRYLWLGGAYEPGNATTLEEGINLMETEEIFPYPSFAFNLGYCIY